MQEVWLVPERNEQSLERDGIEHGRGPVALAAVLERDDDVLARVGRRIFHHLPFVDRRIGSDGELDRAIAFRESGDEVLHVLEALAQQLAAVNLFFGPIQRVAGEHGRGRANRKRAATLISAGGRWPPG